MRDTETGKHTVSHGYSERETKYKNKTHRLRHTKTDTETDKHTARNTDMVRKREKKKYTNRQIQTHKRTFRERQ